MQAIVVLSHGGLEALELLEVPDPSSRPGHVSVRVTHVGLNHLDVWVRRGVDGHPFPLPLIPGSDIVGIREDTGERVAIHPARSCMKCEAYTAGRHDLCRRFAILGEGTDGGCCERVIVEEPYLMPCPLPGEQAAALPLALLTAWHMLIGRARVQPGDRVVVQSGAGGVASLAIQVAKMAGARVAVTASTAEKRALCLDLGAEVAYSHEEGLAGVKAWTGKAGADIIVEHVGAATWNASMRMVRWGGTIVTCGATTGHLVELDLRALFFKQLSLLGSTMGSLDEMRQAWNCVADGRIRPVVDRILPMTQISEAHRLIEGRLVKGKIVLTADLA